MSFPRVAAFCALTVLLLVRASATLVTVDYWVARPQMAEGFDGQSISLNVPEHVVEAAPNASGCLEAVQWRRCGDRTLSLLPSSERCEWPLRLKFSFDYGAFDGARKHYELDAQVGRPPALRDDDDDDSLVGGPCAFWATPDLADSVSGDRVTTDFWNQDQSVFRRLTLIRTCRLALYPGLSAWTINATGPHATAMINQDAWAGTDRFFSVPRDGIMQTVAPTVSFGGRLDALTHFPRATPTRLDGPASGKLCFCGYNVVCGAQAKRGRRADPADLWLHRVLDASPVQNFGAFDRFQIEETTGARYLGNVTILFSIVASLALVGIAVYLYATELVIVLRNTREVRQIVRSFS